MNSRRLWNSHQRHKFLRAEASRDILKLRVSKMMFPGVFKWYFPLQPPCCFVTIHARLGTMASACPWRLAFHDIARFERFTDLNPFKYAFCAIQNWETDALQFILFDGAYFLLVVMVEGDESNRQRMAN